MDCPPTLCGKVMKITKSEKYLGDMISSDGLADSVTATVLKRKGSVKLEIKLVMVYTSEYEYTKLFYCLF